MSKPRRDPIQSLKGMEDLLPPISGQWRIIENKLRTVFESWSFKEIRTPVLERVELFKRSIGEETDIVSKEMFSFKDRGDREITLRPEMTASTVRSYIQHHLGEGKRYTGLYYLGSMYRAERPQKGRKREFYQAGCEWFGDGGPFEDITILAVLHEALSKIGLSEFKIKINHLGTQPERESFTAALKYFLSAAKEKLSEDSQRRLESNVLRILDSKAPGDQEILKGAPKISEHLGADSKGHLEVVKKGLDTLGIAYEVDLNIVRGLDYYTGLVFEVTHASLGAQDAIGAGGRYDGLVESLGGPQTAASGFALGMERMMIALEAEGQVPENEANLVYFGALKDDVDYHTLILKLTGEARAEGFQMLADYSQTSLKKHLTNANKLGARFVVILGEDERAKQEVLIKDMKTGDQKSIGQGLLGLYLKEVK
jgi:histidyl-tRNA synthetase